MEASIALRARPLRCTAGCGELDAVEGTDCPECSAPLEVLLGSCDDCGQETESPLVTECNVCAAHARHIDNQIDARDFDHE